MVEAHPRLQVVAVSDGPPEQGGATRTRRRAVASGVVWSWPRSGAGRQELFLDRYLGPIGAATGIGVGGAPSTSRRPGAPRPGGRPPPRPRVGVAARGPAVAAQATVGAPGLLVARAPRGRRCPRRTLTPMLSIIVPAYNEEQRLPATLVRMRPPTSRAATSRGMRSWSSTTAAPTAPLAIVPRHRGGLAATAGPGTERNTGKGAAVRLGMLSAIGEHRVFSDADLSTPIEEVEQLRARLHGNCAVAIASRALPESQIDVHQPGRREVMGRTYNRLLLVVAALRGLHDTQCGPKDSPPTRAIARFTLPGRPALVSTLMCCPCPAGLADGRGGTGALGAQGGFRVRRDARLGWGSLRFGASTVHRPAIIEE